MAGSTINNTNNNGSTTHANAKFKKRKLRDPFSSVLHFNLSSRDVEHLQSCRPATSNPGTKTQFAVHPQPPSARPLTQSASSGVLPSTKPITCCITIQHGTDRILFSTTTFELASNDLTKVLVGVTEHLVAPDPENPTIPIQALNFILQTAALKSKINPVKSQEPCINSTAQHFEPVLQQLSKSTEDPISDQFGALDNTGYSPYALVSTNQSISNASKQETITPRPPVSEVSALVAEKSIVKHRSRAVLKSLGLLTLGSPFPPAMFTIDNVEKLTFYLETLTIRPGMVFTSHEEVKFMALVYNLLITKRPYIVQYDNKKRGIFRLGCSRCSFAFRTTNLTVYIDEDLWFPYPSLIYVTEFVPHTCAPHPVAEETRLVSTKWHNYLALLFDFFSGPWKLPSPEKREIVLKVIEQLYMVVESNTVIRPLKSKLSRLSSLISIYTRGGFELSVHPQTLLSRLFLPALLIQTKFPKSLVRLYFDSDSQHDQSSVRIYAPPLKTDGALDGLRKDRFDNLIERALPRYLSHIGKPTLRPVGTLDLDMERFIQDQLLAFGSGLVGSVSNSTDDDDEEPPENYWTVDSLLQNNSSAAFNMSQSQRSNNSSFINADMILSSERFFNEVSIDQKSYISYLQSLKAIKTTTERIQFIRMEYMKFDIASGVSPAVLPELPPIAVAVKTGFEPTICHLECCKIDSVERCSKHANLESNHKFYTKYVEERTGVNPHVFADLVQQTFPDCKSVNNSNFKGITIITEDMRKAAQYCLPLISIDKISSRTKTYGHYNLISAVGYSIENDLSIFGFSIVPETDQYLLDGYLEFFRDLNLTYGTLFNDRHYSFASRDVTGSEGIEYALETVFPECKRYKSFVHWKQDYLRQVPLKKRDSCKQILNKLLIFSDDPSSPNYKRVLAELKTEYSLLGSLVDHDENQAVYSEVGLFFGHASTDASEAFHLLIGDFLKQPPLMILPEICKIQQRVMARTVDSIATGCKIRFANDRVALTPKCSEMLVLSALFASQFEVVSTETSANFCVHLKEDSFLRFHQENLLEVPLLYESIHFVTDTSTNTLVHPGEIAKLAVQLLLSKKQYAVDFERRRCSCGYFQRNQMPCPHALTVLLSTDRLGPVSNYCNKVFHCSLSSPAAHIMGDKAATSVPVTEFNLTLTDVMFFNEFVKHVSPGYHVDDDILEENGARPEYIANLTKTIISQLSS